MFRCHMHVSIRHPHRIVVLVSLDLHFLLQPVMYRTQSLLVLQLHLELLNFSLPFLFSLLLVCMFSCPLVLMLLLLRAQLLLVLLVFLW